MPPACGQDCPTDVDIDDPVQVQEVYDCYEQTYSQAERDAQRSQAESEMLLRLQDELGTTDFTSALLLMPLWSGFIPGEWGFSHAFLLISELEARQLAGDTDQELIDKGNELVRRYYVREAKARCAQGITAWLDPTQWNEDSRLDYFSPLLFTQWWISNL
jgi:hypothetical protein